MQTLQHEGVEIDPICTLIVNLIYDTIQVFYVQIGFIPTASFRWLTAFQMPRSFLQLFEILFTIFCVEHVVFNQIFNEIYLLLPRPIYRVR